MAQSFHETAHNHIDPKKYAEGWEHIFGKKEDPETKCRCEDKERDLSFSGIDVVCGTCNRILAKKD